jgi:hypothetical protein
MNTVILLTFILKSAAGVAVEDLAIVKDRETCEMIAAVLNEVPSIKTDPDAIVVCREAKPPTKA